MSTEGIARHGIRLDQRALEAFCVRNGIKKLSLFGSALRPDFSADSDVDVLVEFAPGRVPGLAFFGMEIELSGMLGRKVDLNTPGFIGPRFRRQVEAEAEALYEQT
jgi:hypothetical protein